MGESSSDSGVVYESLIKLASEDADMPDGLMLAEAYLFRMMQSLYADFRKGNITADQGKRQKMQIITAYQNATSSQRMWDDVRRRKMEGETFVNEYRKNPTIENADKAIDILYSDVRRKTR
ncbi:MAG: hypothetical protein LUC16_04045 [Coprobacillus sp.]|nr:hypothetical protein [Coprobacillus sp.]